MYKFRLLNKPLFMILLCLSVLPARAAFAGALPDTVSQVAPGVVGVGTIQRIRHPAAKLLGTGFAVLDGRHVITNAHVIPDIVDTPNLEFLAVFTGRGKQAKERQARKIAVDLDHDLALLEISGAPLPALTLGDSDRVREGELYAFTGFPIGMLLGLFPATHRGIIAAITPIAVPANAARQLDPKVIQMLRQSYEVFQLDATAYPGNSGSPLYDPETGIVIGIINKVFIKQGKEFALEKPSGITYAIPARYARDMLKRAGLLK